jgi:hypothetical protein
MATALETAIQAEITAMPAGIRKEAAQEKLSEYVAAKSAAASAASNDVISYTISGRSVTRRNNSEFRVFVRELETELMNLIYGSESLISFSTETSR